MSPSCLPLTSFDYRRKISVERTVVFFHFGLDSVDDTTYFGIELNLSAKSPSRDGHASAKPSCRAGTYVRHYLEEAYDSPRLVHHIRVTRQRLRGKLPATPAQICAPLLLREAALSRRPSMSPRPSGALFPCCGKAAMCKRWQDAGPP